MVSKCDSSYFLSFRTFLKYYSFELCAHHSHATSRMIQCQNCGKSNTPESQFCRFCGIRITQRQPENYEYRPPRSYAWQTDEFETQGEARVAQTSDYVMTPNQQLAHPVYNPAQMAYRGPQDFTGRYRCPHCGTNYLPVMERRISSAGWLTFALLLVFTFIFFWIGLLMKEDVAICPICKRRVN